MPLQLKTNPLAALSPLKVLIVAEKSKTPDDREPYFTAITRSFQGGNTRSPDGSEEYYAMGEELGVDVRRYVGDEVWGAKAKYPVPDTRQLLESCGHLLVVVLLEGKSASNSKFVRWLEDLAGLALDMDGRIGILPIAFDPEAEQQSFDKFNEFQRMPISELGEFSLQAGHMGLLALQNAWTLLGAGSEDRLTLFISHAKRDGAPIALALKSQIESLRFLQRFYDAHDILPGTRWRKVLQEGVRKSVLVVLRTDIYEQRPWCVQELQWAEEFGCAAIIVDARNSLLIPREMLPVSGMATVRIPDGNLVRVLNATMREAVRVRLFRRSVQLLEESKALPTGRTMGVARASLSALAVTCDAYFRDKKHIEAVVVAEPFRESQRPAAERLVNSYFEMAVLGSLRDFAMRNINAS